jgi:membrane-associated phospholipid phosphatase
MSRRTPRGIYEIALLGVLYAGYSVTRLFADDDAARAREHALSLVSTERALGLDREGSLNHLFLTSETLRLLGSYWYATLHYVVTVVVLVWLYRRGRATSYLPARRALVLASLAALACYLLVPMAPPRFLPGYVDVLHLTAADGWWGGDASAPRGLGELTNQLAAFPSLHAGWSLWVALVVTRELRSVWARGLAWAYVAGTAAVIVGTGNHWILDVVGGWAVVLAAWLLVGGSPDRGLGTSTRQDTAGESGLSRSRPAG